MKNFTWTSRRRLRKLLSLGGQSQHVFDIAVGPRRGEPAVIGNKSYGLVPGHPEKLGKYSEHMAEWAREKFAENVNVGLTLLRY